MAKVSLEVPEKMHLQIKKEQLEREINDKKINLADLYYEIIRLGLEKLEEKEKASQK